MNKKKSNSAKIAQALSLLSQLSIMMLVSIFGCFFIGRFIDEKLNTAPIFMLIFLILGIIGVVVFKFIRNILPAKADEKYDYE